MGKPQEPTRSLGLSDQRHKSQAPVLPPVPTLELMPVDFDSPSDHPTCLQTLPPEIRALIYDRLIPHGPQITLRFHSHTTKLKHLYNLARTCRALHTEITTYLQLRPLTILCTNDLSPTILSDIPPRILDKVETLAIEGYGSSAGPEPSWPLLPGINSICFTETYDIKNIQPQPPTTHESPTPFPTPFQPSLHRDRSHTMTPTYPLHPASLPTNNTVLAHAHRYWQDLRLQNHWVMHLWKRTEPPYDTMRHIRVILRRVFEGHVSLHTQTTTPNEPSEAQQQEDDDKVEGATVTYHAVVDVDSRKVLENQYVGTRMIRRGDAKKSWEQKQEATMFAYAAQRWWRKEMLVKGTKE